MHGVEKMGPHNCGFQDTMHFFRLMLLARKYIENSGDRTHLADEELDNEETEQTHHQIQDEWMVLCQLNPRFVQTLEAMRSHYKH